MAETSFLDWPFLEQRHRELAAVDEGIAAEVLAHRTLRAFDTIPQRPGVRGRAIYVPLVAGQPGGGALHILKNRRVGHEAAKGGRAVPFQIVGKGGEFSHQQASSP